MAGYAIRTSPYAVVHAIDIDRDVVELGGRYFGLSPNPRLHIHLQDGRQWPERSKDAFDLIMRDAYDDSSIPTPLRGTLTSSGSSPPAWPIGASLCNTPTGHRWTSDS